MASDSRVFSPRFNCRLSGLLPGVTLEEGVERNPGDDVGIAEGLDFPTGDAEGWDFLVVRSPRGAGEAFEAVSGAV